jgi:hypothetical protein
MQQMHQSSCLLTDRALQHWHLRSDSFSVLAGSPAGSDLRCPVCCPTTGKVNSTGAAKGKGFTINVPLPGDSGHDSMLSVWERVIEPAACRHKPDIILCSAGRCAPRCRWKTRLVSCM